MTLQTPVNNSLHLAALAESAHDIRAPIGMCDLMGKTVQLLPLRYALVERLDPSAALDLPFNLSSHPMGIRLLRDGYLYLIDNGSGYLHEYQIEQGRSFKVKLWPTLIFLKDGQEVARLVRPLDSAEIAQAFNLINPTANTSPRSELPAVNREAMLESCPTNTVIFGALVRSVTRA